MKEIVQHRKVGTVSWSKFDRQQIMVYLRRGLSDHAIAKLMGCKSHVTIAQFRYARGIVANHTDITGFRLNVPGLKRRQEAELEKHRAYSKRCNKTFLEVR